MNTTVIDVVHNLTGTLELLNTTYQHGLSNSTRPTPEQRITTAFNPTRYCYLLLATLALAGILGNLLVIIAVCKVPKLRNNTNVHLSSLATADLLVCVLVMPFGIIQLFADGWPLGDTACGIYIFTDVSLCTSSILHMCCVSLDRYLGIAFPLRYTSFRTRRAQWYKILGVWLLSAAIGSPVFLHAHLNRDSIFMGSWCGVNNIAFQVYGSICAFYGPLIVMFVTYCRTIRMLNQQSSRKFEMEGNDHPGLRRTVGSVKNGMARRTVSNKETGERVLLQKHNSTYSTLSGDSGVFDSSQMSLRADRHTYHTHTETIPESEVISIKTPATRCKPESTQLTVKTNCCRSQTDQTETPASYAKTNTRTLGRRSNSEEHTPIQNKRLPPRRCNSETNDELRTMKEQLRKSVSALTLERLSKAVQRFRRSDSKRKNGQIAGEKKATQVLGIIFISFVICWGPFFIINVLTVLCPHCLINDTLMHLVLWLGYSASIINPLIYTVFNKHFQKSFRDILKCAIWNKQPMMFDLQNSVRQLNQECSLVISGHLGTKTVLLRNCSTTGYKS